MTDRPVAALDGRYPAPGSSIPGAPPALKRPLTPADGVASGADAVVRQEVAAACEPAAAASRAGIVPAAAMLGIAIGLELSRFLTARNR